MRASGLSGELRVGYQQAARLGAWSIELEPRIPRECTLRARVLSEHPYWITQQPLDVVVLLGNRVEWLWRDVQVARAEDGIVVTLSDRPIVDERREAAELER